MTKMTRTMQLALGVAMAAGSMAVAQSTAGKPVTSAPGLDLQMNVAVNVGLQVKDDLFGDTDKFANGAAEVTEINLDPSTMGMVGKDKGKDGDLARKMKRMVIHTYKYDKPGMYRMEDLDAYRKKLEDGSWNCSIHVRSKTGSTDICSRSSSDHATNEMVILTAEPQKLTFIHMSGNMSLDELDDMSGSANRLDHRVRPPHSMSPTPPTPPTPPNPKFAQPEPPSPPML
jgi:hypothetical protein